MGKIWNKQKEIIKEKMNNLQITRVQLAEELGISERTLHRWIRKLGGDTNRGKYQSSVYSDIVRRLYPTHTAKEIVEMYAHDGIKLYPQIIITKAKKLGVMHTPETMERIRQKRVEYLTLAHTPENRQKAKERYAKIRKMEEIRHMSGMQQKTKMKFREMPRKHYIGMFYLVSKYGYIRTTDPYTLWYDDNTQRTPNEAYFERKYKLTFEPSE